MSVADLYLNYAYGVFAAFALLFAYRPIREYFLWLPIGMPIFTAFLSLLPDPSGNIGEMIASGFVLSVICLSALGAVVMAEGIGRQIGLIKSPQ